MTGISAVIITRNEAHNIERCIASLTGVVDEVVVVDAESTDNTRELASAMGARVIVRPWTNYSDQKNHANELASSAFILSMDADEALSGALRASLMKVIDQGPEGAYRFSRLTNHCGHWVRHGGWYPDAKVRLFPRTGTRWEGEHVHETLALPPNTAITDLQGDLLHFSYPTIASHEERIERYSTLHAEGMHARGKKAGPVKRWLSPVAKFIQGYFLQLGFLDGRAGWRIATLSARAVFLKYRKLHAMYRADANT
ncbi:MAG: glycosyltransferase family 2 protein [Flavobacteriales bacterium]|nr:glycosyltransferase family 2 protein [Flavobacteriales bacterium]